MLICISLACSEPVFASASTSTSIDENAKPGGSSSLFGKIKHSIVRRIASKDKDDLALGKDVGNTFA